MLLKEYKEGRAHSLTYLHLASCLIIQATEQKNKKKLFKLGERIVDMLREALEKKEMFLEDDPIIPKFHDMIGAGYIFMYQGNQEDDYLQLARLEFEANWQDYKSPTSALELAAINMERRNFKEAIVILEELYEMYKKDKGFLMTNIPIDVVALEKNMIQYLGDCYYQRIQENIFDDKVGIKIINKEETEKHKKKMLEKAEFFYTMYLSIEQKNVLVIDRLAQILRNTNRLEDAQNLSLMAVNTSLGYYIGWENLGMYEIMNKRYATGLIFLNECLRLKPDYKKARLNRDACLKAMRR